MDDVSTNISVVLFNNSVQQITQLLCDILQSINIAIMHIYLIDNSSNDNLRCLADYHQTIIYWKRPNLGYGRAHNIAMRASKLTTAQYHLVLNPDIRFEPHVLGAIVAYMQMNPNIGLLMPRIIYPDGSLQCLCKELPTLWPLLARRTIPKKYAHRVNFNYCMHYTDYLTIQAVPYLSGCFMYFRISDLQDIGLFDERFFLYFEDTDISRRFFVRNKAWYYPAVTAIHEHQQQSYRQFKLFCIHIINMCRYFNKYGWFYDAQRRLINQQLRQQEYTA